MTNAVKKIVRTYFGKTEINFDGLMEIFEQTGNADVALDILLGTYEPPEIPQQAKIWGHLGTFQSFNKWTNTVHYTYRGPKNDYVYIDKNVDPKTITPENLAEHTRKYGAPDGVSAYVNTHADYQHESDCKLEDWLEGAKKVEIPTPEK